mgnify:CR=1 FL=1
MCPRNSQKFPKEIIAKISQCFRIKAEDFSDSEIAAYFAGREEVLAQLKNKKNQFLIGRKGTGKTMILKFLTVPVQYHLDRNGSGFIGVYFNVKNFVPSLRFDPHQDTDISLLMGHWFNLFVVGKLLENVHFMNTQKIFGMHNEAEKEIIGELWNSFFGMREALLTNVDDVIEYFDRQQGKLKEYLEKFPLFFERKNLLRHYCDKTMYRGELKSIKEFPQLIRIVSKGIHKVSEKSKPIFILIDEFDILTYAQQTLINSIIQDNSFYSVKVGCLHMKKIKSRENLDHIKIRDDELPIVDLEFETTECYAAFAKKVIQTIFDKVQEKLSDYPEISSLFRAADTLLPGKPIRDQMTELEVSPVGSTEGSLFPQTQPEMDRHAWKGLIVDNVLEYRSILAAKKRPIYTGVDNISLLSFGFIRYTLEIVHAVLVGTFKKDLGFVAQQGGVSYDRQDEFIRSEATAWLGSKIRSLVLEETSDGEGALADMLMNFLGNIGNKFKVGFIRYANSPINAFSVSKIPYPKDDCIRAIEEAEVVGIISEIKDFNFVSRDERCFALLGIYAVPNDLPPVVTFPLVLQWSEFKRMFGHVYRLKQPEMKLEVKPKKFLGIGFREKWEDKVRETIKSLCPEELLTGEGVHSETGLVVETVRRRIEAADYCIFDITYPNENIIFEYGFAIARQKRIYFIQNKAMKKRMRTKIRESTYMDVDVDEILFLKNAAHWEPYSFTNGTSKEVDTLRAVLLKLDAFYGKAMKKGCFLDSKCKVMPLDKATREKRQPVVFLHLPDTAPSYAWLKDIKNFIVEHVGLVVYPFTSSLLTDFSLRAETNDKHAFICPRCRAIGRSTFCIIDTSKKEWNSCGILGFAFGMRRDILNIYHTKQEGLITNWKGKLAIPYRDKSDLLKTIKDFLQTAGA